MDNQSLTEEINSKIDAMVAELAAAGNLDEGSVIVLGCSTSEVVGGNIGKASVPELGVVIARAMIDACQSRHMVPAFQCCEHLNRSIVIDKSAAKSLGLTMVKAIPQPKAGGSVPAAAWHQLTDPCLVCRIQADAAIDIGDTLVGMHLRPVAVPLRTTFRKIGDANAVMAYSRLPYIGGSRAVYEE